MAHRKPRRRQNRLGCNGIFRLGLAQRRHNPQRPPVWRVRHHNDSAERPVANRNLPEGILPNPRRRHSGAARQEQQRVHLPHRRSPRVDKRGLPADLCRGAQQQRPGAQLRHNIRAGRLSAEGQHSAGRRLPQPQCNRSDASRRRRHIQPERQRQCGLLDAELRCRLGQRAERRQRHLHRERAAAHLCKGARMSDNVQGRRI